MGQTEQGALIVAAAKAGVSVEKYQDLRRLGLKRCSNCKQWHNIRWFGKDASRHDGLAASCLQSRRIAGRRSYKPKPRPRKGRRFVSARDGDVNQAQRRVNYLVEIGLLPRPNDVDCADCGHVWRPGERRHEYDHFRGYAAANHEDVQSVCTSCHHNREQQRAASRHLPGHYHDNKPNEGARQTAASRSGSQGIRTVVPHLPGEDVDIAGGGGA